MRWVLLALIGFLLVSCSNGTMIINQVPQNLEVSSLTISELKGSYNNSEAYLCINNSGRVYAREAACP